jgi:excisionase family DNA binding protein
MEEINPTVRSTKKTRTNFEVRKVTANPERLQADPNALLNKHDVASRLEVNVQTVLKWARLGDLDAIRLGRRTVRFTQAAVAKFLARKAR